MEYPHYWKAEYNRQMGLAVMQQKSSNVNSQVAVMIMLPKEQAEVVADAVIKVLAAPPLGDGER